MITILRRLLSFYTPITKNIRSQYSGDLELRFIDGKVSLHSAFANYSYGTLQRVLEFALCQIGLSDVHTVLLLGLGGGSVIKSLRKRFGYKGEIDAVDIDPVIIGIASKEFGIVQNRKTKIKCCHAFECIRKETKRFDLIIVDLFIDKSVPEEILSGDFWYSLKDRVSSNGYIIFNSMHEGNKITKTIKNEMKKWGFSVKEYNHVENYSTVLIAKSCISSWFG